MKPFLTLALYLLILAMIGLGTVAEGEHDEVEAYASLICYTCIGVD
jgi:hypothetical protein